MTIATDTLNNLPKEQFALVPGALVPAEQITSHALFQGVDQVEEMMVREDYRDYLERRLSKVKQISLNELNLPIEATSDDIIDELQFWKVPNFIWPNILQNNEGGLVFVWSVYHDHIRFERSKTGYYSVRIWNTDPTINNGRRKRTSDPAFLEIILPIAYSRMITSLKDKDWKSLLDPENKRR